MCGANIFYDKIHGFEDFPKFVYIDTMKFPIFYYLQMHL